MDGGRLLRNIVTVSVFITLTRERYLLLLFAELAAPERGQPTGSSPFGRSRGSRGWEREAGAGQRSGAARGRPGQPRPVGFSPRSFPQPARLTPSRALFSRGETAEAG